MPIEKIREVLPDSQVIRINPAVLLRILTRQIALLVVVAAIPSLLAAVWHPRRPAWNEICAISVVNTTLEETCAAHRQPLVLDARSPAAFHREHFPAALPLSLEQWESDFPHVVAVWHPDSTLVVYGDGSRDDPGLIVARRLARELGARNIVVLRHGWPAASTSAR